MMDSVNAFDTFHIYIILVLEMSSYLTTLYNNSYLGASYFTGAVPNIKNGQLRGLEHCYRRHVKPKKQHEIIKLAEVR